ncbi:MAG: hypothetical protein HYY06_26200 [Deltaproteobacteria bacterium]|nr:hypothetical protein [Deltaproteobacteria bacterium]
MRSATVLAALVAIAGCAQNPGLARVEAPLGRGDVAGALKRYETMVKRRRPDRLEALERIAGTVLVHAARSPDRSVRDRAFVALGALGEEGRPWLVRLTGDPEPIASRALGALLRIGEDDQASRLQKSVRSPYPEARSSSLVWLREEERWGEVEAMVLDVDAAVRRSALDSLALAPLEEPVAQLGPMRDVLRHDPVAEVRAAAARFIARHGEAAVEALEQALSSDPSISVQVAAVASLARVEARAGRPLRLRVHEILRRTASGEPSPAGIEAARLLAPEDPDAMAYLARALETGPVSTRLQAAVAASGLRALRQDVRTLLADSSPEIRLRAAAGLARSSPADRSAATRVLKELLAVEADPAIALQAAAAFSELRDRRGLPTAARQLASPSASLRGLAVYVVGERIGARERVRSLLVDADPSVRVAAARAILRRSL